MHRVINCLILGEFAALHVFPYLDVQALLVVFIDLTLINIGFFNTNLLVVATVEMIYLYNLFERLICLMLYIGKFRVIVKCFSP